MLSLLTPAIIGIIAIIGYAQARSRAQVWHANAGKTERPHSLPPYYGGYAACWMLLPPLLLLLAYLVGRQQFIDAATLSRLPESLLTAYEGRTHLLLDRLHMLAPRAGASADAEWAAAIETYARRQQWLDGGAMGLGILAALTGGLLAFRKLAPSFAAREALERMTRRALALAASVSILATIAIVLSVLFEAIRFFELVPVTDFLFGTHWSPQSAAHGDAGGAFGAVSLFTGTLLVTLIAMAVAAPIGLFSAVYLSEYASPRLRAFVKPALEILAGVPTVVYGYFAVVAVAPWVKMAGQSLGLDVAAESALAAGLVMGVMIIPFVSSLSDDVIHAVPRALRDASFGLGATHSETITRVVLPAALPGIMGALLLAVSRAIGETMIVVMAAGLSANLTANPLESVTTVTVQIVALLVGDHEFDSAKTLASFALGLTLFVVTLCLNVVALHIVKTYRQKYE